MKRRKGKDKRGKIIVKPEVLQNFPEVSFESFEEAKGKIQQILQKNPRVKQKWLKSMRGNLFAFKSGKYAKLPLFCNNCYAKIKCPVYQEPKDYEYIVCALKDEFKRIIQIANSRDRKDLIEALYRLMGIQIERLGRNYYFELLSGGRQDRNLTLLIKVIEDSIIQLLKLTQSIEYSDEDKAVEGMLKPSGDS